MDPTLPLSLETLGVLREIRGYHLEKAARLTQKLHEYGNNRDPEVVYAQRNAEIFVAAIDAVLNAAIPQKVPS